MSDRVDIVEWLLKWRARFGVDIAGPETPDRCEEAAAEIKRLREEQRWIPVEEKLPSDNVAVLCWVDGCGAEMAWREEGQWFLSFAGYPISESTYTHWMPLPEKEEVG